MSGRRTAFTLIELLVVITIIAALIAMGFQGIQSVRAAGRNAECQTHLEQIGKVYQAVLANDPRNVILPTTWTTQLIGSLKGQDAVYKCPDATTPLSDTLKSHYGMNGRANRLVHEANKILMLDYNDTIADVMADDKAKLFPDMVGARHSGSCNVLFYDGHVESKTPDDIDPRVSNLYNELWRPKIDGNVSRK